MSEERIRSLRVRAVRVPMPEPHRTASGVISESPLVLIDLETHAGAVGRAMVFTYATAALGPVAEFLANLEPLVRDRPLAPAMLTAGLVTRFRLLGSHGLVGMALSGLDMAAWDAAARGAQTPLCRLLGASPRPTPAYGGVGFEGPKGSAEAAERWVRKGLRGVKAKIGYATIAEDIAVVRAMRSAVGPGVAIMVDYNQCLPPAEARARARALDAEGIDWIEEPVVAEDYAGMATVAEAAATPIQAGENWWGPLEFSKALDAGAADFIMPDLMKVFGVTGWMQTVGLAGARGVRISSHLFPEPSAQVLAATPNAHWLEYMDWWSAVLAEPLEIRDGNAVPADRPGSGIEWDEGRIAKLPA
jgi:mandelate racemase